MASAEAVVVPHLDVVVDPAKVAEDSVQILTQIRPKWKKENIQFSDSPLGVSRGMVNTMVKCYDGDNKSDAIMIRVHSTKMDIIDRSNNNEVKAIKYFHPRGCAPNIQATFRNGFCYEFIQGEVLSAPRLREEKIWRALAEEFAKFHTGIYEDEVLNRNTDTMTNIVTQMLANYPPVMRNEEDNERLKKTLPTKEEMNAEFELVFDHVSQLGSPMVICHNDTRPENIVWNEETGKVHLVDFEAIGYGRQAFEIANHFSRYSGINPPDFSQLPDEELQNKWLRVYLRKVFQLKGKNPDDVTDTDVRRLFVQVAKYELLAFLFYSLAVMWESRLEESAANQMNFLDFSESNYEWYKAVKEKTLALALP